MKMMSSGAADVTLFEGSVMMMLAEHITALEERKPITMGEIKAAGMPTIQMSELGKYYCKGGPVIDPTKKFIIKPEIPEGEKPWYKRLYLFFVNIFKHKAI